MTGATFDSNVYISAFQFGGTGVRLLELAHHGLIRIDISDEIVNETIGVLRDKFQWDGYRLQDLSQKLLRIGNRVVPAIKLAVCVDPDDDRILECAREAGSQSIVTQDKDLLRLGHYEEIEIVPPADFLRRFAY
jgi:putative PIN family toxin of toxin-antitoxin system